MRVEPISTYNIKALAQLMLELWPTEWGRQKDCKQLASDTELNNVTSIEFHKRMGFLEASRIVCFIRGRGWTIVELIARRINENKKLEYLIINYILVIRINKTIA